MTHNPFAGAWPVCRKEITHISRDRATLFFALFIPIMQMVLFGFAIDTNVRQIPTVVLDEAGTQESRRMLEKFVTTDAFDIIGVVRSDDELYKAIQSGRAKVGIRFPVDFSRRVLEGRTASVQIVIDGSDNTTTSYAVNVSNGVMQREALQRLAGPPPFDVRQQVLFNPALRSPNFFVPGLVAVMLQMMIMMLTAFSIVRERERGTLEQLSLTPITPLGLMVGKMGPYGLLGFLELCVILAIMRLVFQVPIKGSLSLLLLFSVPFLLTILGIGLLISTKAKTQSEAFQLAVGTLLPSVFLSGYIFMVQNMPVVFQGVSKIIPATYYISILRGIILRGADFGQMWVDAAVLLVMGIVTVLLAARQFVRGAVAG